MSDRMTWQQKHGDLVRRRILVRRKLEAVRQEGFALEEENVALKVQIEDARQHMEAEMLREVSG